jgi:uncharacterized membrane protein
MTLAVGSVVILILAVLHICAYTFGGSLGEIQFYYLPYSNAILDGIAPYTPFSDLKWEYPPLGFLIMLVPALASTDVWGYQAAYGLWAAAVAIVGLAVVQKVTKAYDGDTSLSAAIYVVGMALLPLFIFERYDIFPAVFTVCAMYLYLKGRVGWAMLFLSLGALSKLYPALLMPVFLIPYAVKKEWGKAIGNAAIFAVASVVLTIPFILLQPEHFTTFLSYHSDRGIQLESIASSAILVVELLGLTATYTDNSFGSFNLSGSLPDAVSGLMMPLTIAALLLCYVYYYVQIKRSEGCGDYLKRSVPTMVFLTVLIFVIFNKVFSAQYLVWLLPLAAVFFTSREKLPMLPLAYFAGAVLLTMPFLSIYPGFCAHVPLMVLYLLVRNVLMVLLTVEVLRALRYGGARSAESTAERLKRLLRDGPAPRRRQSGEHQER